jgi:hypothetical protein
MSGVLRSACACLCDNQFPTRIPVDLTLFTRLIPWAKLSLSILINLDHPVVSAALSDGSVEEIGFRRLSYEIAFSEYAMALGYELLKQDPNMPPDDLLYEVRSSLNRVAASANSLYR